jgi:hypothetical protein
MGERSVRVGEEVTVVKIRIRKNSKYLGTLLG